MKKFSTRRSIAAALLGLGTMAASSVASAVPIGINGALDVVFSLSGGSSPFSVGDPISGLFDVDLGPNNNFVLGNAVSNSVGSLSSFDLTVGPANFALSTSDITQLSGQISDDGTMLSNFFLDTRYLDVGLGKRYKLQIQNGSDILYVDGGPIIRGPITESVGATDVPTPGSLGLFGFALLLLTGMSIHRQRIRDSRG